jgi:hypothetical protein
MTFVTGRSDWHHAKLVARDATDQKDANDQSPRRRVSSYGLCNDEYSESFVVLSRSFGEAGARHSLAETTFL